MSITNRDLDQQGGILALPADHPTNAHEGTLLAKIGQLEADLRLKDSVISHCLEERGQLRGHLVACIQINQGTTGQLTRASVDLKDWHGQIMTQVEGLEKEITALRHANDTWARRAIRFEIEALAAQKKVMAANAERDLAASKVAELELTLKDTKG